MLQIVFMFRLVDIMCIHLHFHYMVCASPLIPHFSLHCRSHVCAYATAVGVAICSLSHESVHVIRDGAVQRSTIRCNAVSSHIKNADRGDFSE